LDDISVSELGGQKTMSIAADGLNDWGSLEALRRHSFSVKGQMVQVTGKL
jgi:hypothetical protein